MQQPLAAESFNTLADLQTIGEMPLAGMWKPSSENTERSIVQEPQQEWPLSSSRLELSQAAAWDARTQRMYAVAAVRPGGAQVAEKGCQLRLLGWPTSYTGALEDAPISIELHSAVHAVHPIFSSASTAPAKDAAGEQHHRGVAAGEQHNSSSAAESLSAQSALASQKHQVGSTQCTPQTATLFCNFRRCGRW